ncbi:aminoglycoside phosphotransferase family protein [Labedella endophytica]|uniref:Aminoglycoside phosphotransferase family protein n=1 Tax=Labedella endophytica TaxID=1523160 RepID=A0A433JRE6_9MICO|nr:aminoglycoside phosphotransferase family protein [Labedella endophytica]RUQ99236.1 aminoglycoside phosphotransferase family protein [Labedella endophytica]
MAVTPTAELDIDATLVASLLSDQHPDLAGEPLRLVANGWDNTLFRLGDDLLVRLPRRAAAAQLVEHEAAWLPILSALVPVATPVPVRTGSPSWRYPWSWTISRWIDGESARRLTPGQRAPLARPLAEALTALHVPAPSDAPLNPVRGVDLRSRDAAVRGRLTASASPAAGGLEALWSDLVDARAWSREPVWVHGDPHPGNVLVRDGRLAALIDFGDLCAGDPATDLAAGWLFFEPDARAHFRATADARGHYDAADWVRARAWALIMGTAIDAHSDDDPAMAALAAHTLTQVAEG